jgi:signal transduction histidine kinase
VKIDDALRVTFELVPMALGVRALAGDDVVHIFDNAAAAAQIGRTPDETMGRTARALGVNPELLHDCIERMRVAESTGEPVHAEIAYECPKGVRTVVQRIAPVAGSRDEQGRLLFIAVVEDVTELRHLQASVEHSERLATVGTLTASLGHELASPLTVISTTLSLARRHLRSEGKQNKTERYLLDAEEASEHLTQVLVTLREFGAAGVLDVEAEVRLTAIVEAAVRLGGAKLRSGVALHKDLQVDPEMPGGKVKLTQVILNLMLNGARAARFANPEGGAALFIRSRSTRTRTILEVEDNGTGISDDLLGKAFDPFVTTHAGSGGTGLGLFVSRRIVRSLGGEFSLEPAPGGGTVAVISIPARRNSNE